MVINSGTLSLLLKVNWLAALSLKERYDQVSDDYPTALLTFTPGLLPTAVLWPPPPLPPCWLGCLLTGCDSPVLGGSLSGECTTCGLDYPVKFSTTWLVVGTPPMRPESWLGERDHLSSLFFIGYSVSSRIFGRILFIL